MAYDLKNIYSAMALHHGRQPWPVMMDKELLNPIVWMFSVLNFGRRLEYVFNQHFLHDVFQWRAQSQGCLSLNIQSQWFIAMRGNVLEVAKWAVSLKLDKCVVWAGLLQQQLLTRWHASKATTSSAPLWCLCLKPSHLINVNSGIIHLSLTLINQ